MLAPLRHGHTSKVIEWTTISDQNRGGYLSKGRCNAECSNSVRGGGKVVKTRTAARLGRIETNRRLFAAGKTANCTRASIQSATTAHKKAIKKDNEVAALLALSPCPYFLWPCGGHNVLTVMEQGEGASSAPSRHRSLLRMCLPSLLAFRNVSCPPNVTLTNSSCHDFRLPKSSR